MAESIQRNKGRGQGYKFDRGGMPAEFGPFIGIVKNNVDPTRSGRLQVFIEQFAGSNPEDESLWRTVSYVPPFYGATPHTGTDKGAGTFTGNPMSYGMWFTPPDLETSVICFFVAGDPNQGYYIGCVPEPGVNHMIPAVGASRRYQLGNGGQDAYFQGAKQLPVTEINTENQQINDDPRFFDKIKPVHSYVAGIMMQQGLIKDTTRGPIGSNSQRESPSACFGIVTPGRAIYQGGLSEAEIKGKLERGELKPPQVEVIARRGGHSIVMDDGDLEGQDDLVRIRTAKGHQITMSDDGDCFYIIHANGQTWLEFGKQGTVDVFSTNSVNVRTQGTINLHADKDINMFAGGSFNVKSKTMKLETDVSTDIIATGKMTLYSKNIIGVKSDGVLALKSVNLGSWDAGAALSLKADCINLNGGGGLPPVDTPTNIPNLSLADTKFIPNQGWTVEYGKLQTVVTRAPTHEPYPYHNQGTSNITSLTPQNPTELNQQTQKTLSALTNLPVSNPITSASFLKQVPAEISVGSLDTNQVTGLMASVSQTVNQPFDVISNDKGIGQFGFTPSQLESSGFLKPGTVQTYLTNATDIQSILASPSVWTGKSGVDSLPNLLTDASLQSVTQNEIMVSALEGLKSAGIVTGKESPNDLSGLVQTASKFGVDNAVSWVKGLAPPSLVTEMNTYAKNAQQAVSFVDEQASGLVTNRINLGGFTGTVVRDAIDDAVKDVIDDPKIPLPDYAPGEYVEITDETTVVTGGTETTVYSSAVSEQTLEITKLNNEIYDLEQIIAARRKRGQNVALQESELLRLRQQLSSLKQA